MSSSTPEQHDQDDLRIPVIEEQLAVGTRVVDAGRGVRIHKTVSEQPVTIDEQLAHDVVEVRHVAVDRIVAAGETPANRYDGDTLIIPVLEEVLVVERRLRIIEELHISRTRHHERHQETVPLKVERVDVERFDEAGNPPVS
ncbi:YsnF/AvaK domain-containing protein [Massilia sp. H6]|uniref:YsnF/AvaK domain-containing protein n=1 Tax=Massilia sp. H6 TaxID=2970464 RepID=UPI0021688042|nr:YsnF/AvaK domain-containing protein [Massilia sp. H6]UVW27143.1 YsnF/AvaK domain-containing protein [Massilia sp. H6]